MEMRTNPDDLSSFPYNGLVLEKIGNGEMAGEGKVLCISIVTLSFPYPTPAPSPIFPNALPAKHSITIQDGSIENLVY